MEDPHTMFESDSDLLIALQGVGKTVNKVLSEAKGLAKSIEKIDSVKALGRQDYLTDLMDSLKSNDLAMFGCGTDKSELIHAIENRLRTLQMNARQNLMAGLQTAFDNPNHLRILSDSPLVIYMHPLTVEVHFETGKAALTYAHEVLQTVSSVPEEILNAHQQIVENFRASRIDSQQFWQILKLAYDMVLLKEAQPMGARIDIVQLLPALAWIWPNAAATKKNVVFPRYLLAYQLQKLRSDGLLVNRGWRLDLGTATGGSTRNKANVLFIPMGHSEGQYYLSICLRQV